MMTETLAFTKDKNQIATPRHIVEFLSDLLEVKGKRVLDPTAGHGAMLQFSSQRYGIEYDEKPYKMLCERYSDGEFINASVFDCGEWIKSKSPQVILMNPPFNAEKSKGLEFVRFVADAAGTGKLAAILPVRCGCGGNKLIDDIKAELLKKHSLDYVFKFNNELFYPAAAVGVECYVFTLGKPHDGKTFFADFSDDGLVKDRRYGRYDAEGIWQARKAQWLEYCKEKPSYAYVDGKIPCSYKEVETSWTVNDNIKREIEPPTEEDFKATVKDFLDWQMKTLGPKAFHEKYTKELFTKEERAAMKRREIAALLAELAEIEAE